jgi:hypothetical protein
MPTLEKPPMFISIGPQCAGKTTVLSRLPNMVDVNFDDQQFTYSPVPLKHFMRLLRADQPPVFDDSLMPSARRIVFGVSMRDRLRGSREVSEFFPILAFFSHIPGSSYNAPGATTMGTDCPNFGDFMDACAPFLEDEHQRAGDAALLQVFAAAAMQVHASGARVTTRAYDVFIQESRGMSVSQAEQKLDSAAAAHVGPVAWGNTNLNRGTVQAALRIAYENKRPVRFLCWGRDLPAVSLEELVIRNLRRFLATGRFIPCKTLARYYSDANTLYENLRVRGRFDTRLFKEELRHASEGKEVIDSSVDRGYISGEEIFAWGTPTAPGPVLTTTEAAAAAATPVAPERSLDDVIANACGYRMDVNGMLEPIRPLPPLRKSLKRDQGRVRQNQGTRHSQHRR